MRANGYWIAAMLAGASWTGVASAAPCYVIYDRSDAIIYRDYAPPLDLSDPKSPERMMMRQQGQHLLVAEFDNCNPVGFISPTTGATTATVDEIVNGVQPAIATSIANAGGTVRGAPGSGTASKAGAPVARTTSGASGMAKRSY